METVRHPVTGSCHCGNVKYIAILTLPKQADAAFEDKTPRTMSRIYKCNCTPCHKMSFFHVRLVDAPSHFIMLNPASDEEPMANLGDYTCNRAQAHWYFCQSCGVRVFTIIGKGEVAEVDVEDFLASGKASSPQKVWRMKKDGYVEGQGSYFSVNAPTMNHGQGDLDLREWHERGWIRYLDEWKDVGGWQRSTHPGGMY